MSVDNLFQLDLIDLCCHNSYIKAFIDYYVRHFRQNCNDKYSVCIFGLGDFVSKEDRDLFELINLLDQQGFTISFIEDNDTLACLQITYTNLSNGKSTQQTCNIDNLLYIIELSSKTKISTIAIIVIRIIARLIHHTKVLYKAIVLDLDDTVWKGTLAEDGFEVIQANLQSEEGKPYIAFMNFVKVLAEELGIFVAICSRNSQDDVRATIENLDESIFPLKGQINCISANYNDKSSNIQRIANELSILPEAIVFIDDNPIIRDEVRQNLSSTLVPEWTNHEELITTLISSCVFERFELSLRSRNRRRQFDILQQEKEKNSLPELIIKVYEDHNHKEAAKLYAKSNQFKLVAENLDYSGTKSIFFKLFKADGEDLGICSAITYADSESRSILNWAISCRYFGIGLEEFILSYMSQITVDKDIIIVCQDTDKNQKALEMVNSFYGDVLMDDCSSVPTGCDEFVSNFCKEPQLQDLLSRLTIGNYHYSVYWLQEKSTVQEYLNSKTRIQIQ